MKKINEMTVNMILPATVFLGLMAILVGGALFGRIGNRMEVQGEDFSQMKDTQAVHAVCERNEPTIQCIGKKLWHVGETLSVPVVFTAMDAEGEGIDVTVLDITNQDGISVMECYQEQLKRVVFPERGVYTFSLAAMDSERKVCKEKISILVDER